MVSIVLHLLISLCLASSIAQHKGGQAFLLAIAIDSIQASLTREDASCRWWARWRKLAVCSLNWKHFGCIQLRLSLESGIHCYNDDCKKEHRVNGRHGREGASF